MENAYELLNEWWDNKGQDAVLTRSIMDDLPEHIHDILIKYVSELRKIENKLNISDVAEDDHPVNIRRVGRKPLLLSGVHCFSAAIAVIPHSTLRSVVKVDIDNAVSRHTEAVRANAKLVGPAVNGFDITITASHGEMSNKPRIKSETEGCFVLYLARDF